MNAGLAWGCPPWTDPIAFSDCGHWNENRWRWEFLRRKQEVRTTFFCLALDYWRKRYPGTPIPDQPQLNSEIREWRFHLTAPLVASTGITPLPNPAFSHAKIWLDEKVPKPDLDARTIRQLHEGLTNRSGLQSMDFSSVTTIAITFEPSQPIEPQIEGLKEYLLSLRHHSINRLERFHTDKQLTYLRILDAREQGASWAECVSVLSPMTANTAQTARDVHKQAKRHRDSL